MFVLAVLATQFGPTPAAKADTQTVRVSATTASSVSLTKTKFVDCPAGKKVVGTAYNVNNGNREVRINSVVPNATLTRVTVGAAVDPDGYAGSWSLTATAICTSKPLSGLEAVSSWTAQNLGNPKQVVADCPSTKQLLGTAFSLFGSVRGVVIEGVVPNSTTDSVTVSAAHGQTGPAGTWSVGAVAFCADLPFNHWVVTEVDDTDDDSQTYKAATAQCDTGSVLVGVGGEFDYQLGLTLPGPPPPYPAAEVVLDEFTPNGSSVSSPTAVTVWGNEDQDLTDKYWRVTAYALCYGGDFIAQG